MCVCTFLKVIKLMNSPRSAPSHNLLFPCWLPTSYFLWNLFLCHTGYKWCVQALLGILANPHAHRTSDWVVRNSYPVSSLAGSGYSRSKICVVAESLYPPLIWKKMISLRSSSSDKRSAALLKVQRASSSWEARGSSRHFMHEQENFNCRPLAFLSNLRLGLSISEAITFQ